MIWNTAAGIIIGGGVLYIFWFGMSLAAEAHGHKDNEAVSTGFFISLVAVGIGVWIVFFKAHFQ